MIYNVNNYENFDILRKIFEDDEVLALMYNCNHLICSCYVKDITCITTFEEKNRTKLIVRINNVNIYCDIVKI
nr:MAG TPA: hypothetical protein [Caudoviricetes sp.]